MTEALVQRVETDAAPSPAGHYSQAVIANGFVFIAGSMPIRPDRSIPEGESFEAQVRRTLQNLLAVAAAAGCPPGQLTKVTAYIVGTDNWPTFNKVYAEMLGDARPARTVVPVQELHHGLLVEIDAIGVVGS